MRDFTKELPEHIEKYIGPNDLFIEIYEGERYSMMTAERPPLLFVHGAYTGSWMWSKYIAHFTRAGWNCYVMNLRSHYKSRQMDMTRITFDDYLADIREVIAECGVPPVLIGFSMGGILVQKLAETTGLAGLVLIDSSICSEVHAEAPYRELRQLFHDIVVPPPVRDEQSSMDESAEDIAFQRKYLAMESSIAFNAFIINDESAGVSVDSQRITCPCLVIQAVSNEEEEHRGKVMAGYFRGEYRGLWNTTHTGLLVGQRYKEAVDALLEWLDLY